MSAVPFTVRCTDQKRSTAVLIDIAANRAEWPENSSTLSVVTNAPISAIRTMSPPTSAREGAAPGRRGATTRWMPDATSSPSSASS